LDKYAKTLEGATTEGGRDGEGPSGAPKPRAGDDSGKGASTLSNVMEVYAEE